eukprot:jgi/Chrzof1/2369/Cz11g12170.t1
MPEYEDKHIWWIFEQYLEAARFPQTAQTFTDELSKRSQVAMYNKHHITEGELNDHVNCVLTPRPGCG